MYLTLKLWNTLIIVINRYILLLFEHKSQIIYNIAFSLWKKICAGIYSEKDGVKCHENKAVTYISVSFFLLLEYKHFWVLMDLSWGLKTHYLRSLLTKRGTWIRWMVLIMLNRARFYFLIHPRYILIRIVVYLIVLYLLIQRSKWDFMGKTTNNIFFFVIFAIKIEYVQILWHYKPQLTWGHLVLRVGTNAFMKGWVCSWWFLYLGNFHPSSENPNFHSISGTSYSNHPKKYFIFPLPPDLYYSFFPSPLSACTKKKSKTWRRL